MDPTPWLKFRTRNNVHVLGHFKNVHGERFVIYMMDGGHALYFTGDEIDWELKQPLVNTKFMFSPDEREQVAKIVWTTFQDITEVTKAKEAGEALDIWRPWDGTPEPVIEGS